VWHTARAEMPIDEVGHAEIRLGGGSGLYWKGDTAVRDNADAGTSLMVTTYYTRSPFRSDNIYLRPNSEDQLLCLLSQLIGFSISLVSISSF
jgi:hypothetical protein